MPSLQWTTMPSVYTHTHTLERQLLLMTLSSPLSSVGSWSNRWRLVCGWMVPPLGRKPTKAKKIEANHIRWPSHFRSRQLIIQPNRRPFPPMLPKCSPYKVKWPLAINRIMDMANWLRHNIKRVNLICTNGLTERLQLLNASWPHGTRRCNERSILLYSNWLKKKDEFISS